MYEISKVFTFSASHRLRGLPPDHPCSRLHGHNYRVKLVFTKMGEMLNGPGFVIDYRDLDLFKQWLDSEIDHRDLNEVLPDKNPTAELLARQFYDKVWDLKVNPYPVNVSLRVEVSETDKTWASYEPDLLLGEPHD